MTCRCSSDLVPLSAPSLDGSGSPADPGATSRYPDSEPPQYDQAQLYRLLHVSGTRQLEAAGR